ncbi:SMP-30/gluconolactonase/LRE family protein [Amorphus sp. 3PC139-8]|uniref:SMP-30/gluconolactonase/LRE family protein n=1 Tax=Amorphus sp. 3PC139-8 TaxID=2735676 RepID=UPI00345DBA65
MYAAPPSRHLAVATTIPSEHHRSEKNVWIDVQFHGKPAPVFLEGPSFDREGNLWLVDIPWGRLFKITPEGHIHCELDYDGQPNGLAIHKDGRIFIADCKNGILVFDPASKQLETFLDRILLQPFKGPNDLTFASNGDLYFTDQGQTGLHDPTGRVFRVRASGHVECLIDNVPSPNGLVLNAAEDTLFLAVTRDNAIWRVPLVHDGLTTKVGVFIQMSGGGGPDGLAMDSAGNLLVCHVGLGSIWVFNSIGEPIERLKTPDGGLMTTNCAFGGPDNRHLYVTEGLNVLTTEMAQPGRRLYSHA